MSIAEPPLRRPELTVQSFAACEVQRGFRLQGAPVDADTIYLVLAGTLHLSLPSMRLTARAGSMVYVPPGLQPSIAPAPGPAINVVASQNCLVQRAGLLVFDAAHGGAGDVRVMVGRVTGGLAALLQSNGVFASDRPLAGDLTEEPLVRCAFDALLGELDDPSPELAALPATLMKACLLLLIRSLSRRVSANDEAVPAANGAIAAVIAAVCGRPSARYTLDELAAQAGMSRATFARRFGEATGTSPMDFVQQARLREAAAMLRASERPIKQIAADAGFASRSHFTRAFIGRFGVSPSRFRAGERDGSAPPIMPG